MTTRKNEPRFDGYSDRITIGGQPLRQESGVFPEDFPQRLVRLKEVSGLSWSGLAQAIGVDRKQVRRWRQGVEPAGGAMLALVCFAMRIHPAAWPSSRARTFRRAFRRRNGPRP